MKQSAGILLYRFVEHQLQVLLVHPGGPYHVHKDLGAWSIPKGEFEDGADPLVAAKREFREELGHPVTSTSFHRLSPVKQKAGKVVLAWAAEGDLDVSTIVSNTFSMEYPYKSGKWIDVAEVDRAEWFTPQVAREKVNPGQTPLIDELEQLLK